MTDVCAVDILLYTPVAVIIETVTTPAPSIIEVGQQGPRGVGVPIGHNTGDIIRYNADTEEWESCAEPFEFHGIVLIPMSLPGSPVEGFLAYNIEDNGLYVAVE